MFGELERVEGGVVTWGSRVASVRKVFRGHFHRSSRTQQKDSLCSPRAVNSTDASVKVSDKPSKTGDDGSFAT